ncbi:hypothetical protein PMZ80_008117 [Knufia obscura]|uniref:Uncharacterized protein n=1 Tax=Knufia obscura TaxID=1635080 RepID=A0ABR0RGL7_9EURO|nr:hypothetical protein PMZ80_008117 [Knufia obscura]
MNGEAMKSRETLRGRATEVMSVDSRSMRGSLAHADVEDGENAYERQRAVSSGMGHVTSTSRSDRGQVLHEENSRVRTRDVSVDSSPSIFSASGEKRKSWGSPKRLLERMKTRGSWGLTSPSKGNLVKD